MTWKHDGKPITTPPCGSYGFIYLITYTDGTRYVGKKDFYSYQTLPALKSGIQRPDSERIGKNRNGKRVYFDKVKKESKWQSYTGSSKLTKGKKILTKEIIDIAPTKRNLTYLEVKYLFHFNALEDSSYMNDNILGKFYKDNLI